MNYNLTKTVFSIAVLFVSFYFSQKVIVPNLFSIKISQEENLAQTTPPLSGEIIYVDKDQACPGNGSSSTPYCSIQRAFDHTTLGPGDAIKIRDSAQPYSEMAKLTKGGSSASPIIIEPDAGHTPILRNTGANAQDGTINIFNVDYVTVRNLTFDGTGVQTSRYAIVAYADSRNITGIKISGNKIDDWGGTGENTKSAVAINMRNAYHNGAFVDFTVSGIISDNIITNSAQVAIGVSRANGVTIERNDISGMRCGRKSDGGRGGDGIKFGNQGGNYIIRYNKIHDNQEFDNNGGCPLPQQEPGGPVQPFGTAAAIYCDTSPSNGVIENNEIYNINDTLGPGGIGSVGIFIESQCHNWQVRYNDIRNIGGNGIQNSSRRVGNADNNIYEHNSISNVGKHGIIFNRGGGFKVRNNIISTKSTADSAINISDISATGVDANQGGAQVTTVHCGTTTCIINGNLYYDSGSGRIGKWGAINNAVDGVSFSAWKASCASINCDSASPTPANPQFISLSDLHLQSISPAINRGLNLGFPFVGSAPDIGAYEFGGSVSPPPPPPPPPPSLTIPGRIEAENYTSFFDTTNNDVDTKTVTGEGTTVGNTVNGEWLSYTTTVNTTASYSTSFRIANGGTANATIRIQVDSVDKGTLSIPSTGGWSTQSTINGPTISITQGTRIIKVFFDQAPVDLNWFEFIQAVTPLPGDLNGDRIINSIDFSIMNGKWLTADAISDLNKDGTVNSLDFSILNGNWLKTY